MSARLRGLQQANRNANDAISLTQTAEGGVQQLVGALQRMRELGLQAASAQLNDADRRALNFEFAELQRHIEEVSARTRFNGRRLLDGGLSRAQMQIGAGVGETTSVSLEPLSLNALGRQAERVSLRGVNAQIAIGADFSDERVLLSPAQPSTLLSPEVVGVIDPNFPGTPDVVVSEAVPRQLISAEIPAVTEWVPGDDNTPATLRVISPRVPAVYSAEIPAVVIPGVPPRYLVEPQEAVYSDEIPARYDYQYAGALEINGVQVRATTLADDLLSSAQRAGSAIAKAKAINAVSGETGVRALVGPTVLGSPAEVDPGSPTQPQFKYSTEGLSTTRTTKPDVSVNLPSFQEDTDVFLAIDSSASNRPNIIELKQKFKEIVQTLRDLSGGHTVRLGLNFYGDFNLPDDQKLPDFALVDLEDAASREQLTAGVLALDLNLVDASFSEDMHLAIDNASAQPWSPTARQHLIIIGQGDADNDGFDFGQASLDAADSFLAANAATLSGEPQRLISAMQIYSRTLAANKIIFPNMNKSDATSSLWNPDTSPLSYPQQILVTATGEQPSTIAINPYGVGTTLNTSTDLNHLRDDYQGLQLSGLSFPLTLDDLSALSTTALAAVRAGTLSDGDLVINGVNLLAGAELAVQDNDADGALAALINARVNLTGVEARVDGGALTLNRVNGEGPLNVLTTLHGLILTGLPTQDNGKYFVMNGVKVSAGSFDSCEELAADINARGLSFGATALSATALELRLRGEPRAISFQSYGFEVGAQGIYRETVQVPRDDYYPGTGELVSRLAGGALDERSYIELNGVKLSGFLVEQGDASGALRAAINAEFKRTGVRAELDARAELVLVADDGRNIEVRTAGRASSITGLHDIVQGGELTLVSERNIEVRFGLAGVSDMNDALGDLGGAPGLQVFGVSAEAGVSSLDVLTQEGATRALRCVDIALAQTGRALSDLGAQQSALVMTSARLTSSVSDLSAARGRIMDADYAQETAALSSEQIVQQGARSVLAQANQSGTLLLRLLQGL